MMHYEWERKYLYFTKTQNEPITALDIVQRETRNLIGLL